MRTFRSIPALILVALVPLAGGCSSRSNPSAIASGPAPCSARELHAVFVGVQFGTGNDFGSLVVWNSGTEPCRLNGGARFTAYAASGAQDLQAEANSNNTFISTTLAAAMKPYHDGAGLAGYVTASLMGAERDDPLQPDGLCRKMDELTPATLVLGIGDLSVRAQNLDAGRSATTARSVYGCHGKILLEELGTEA